MWAEIGGKKAWEADRHHIPAQHLQQSNLQRDKALILQGTALPSAHLPGVPHQPPQAALRGDVPKPNVAVGRPREQGVEAARVAREAGDAVVVRHGRQEGPGEDPVQLGCRSAGGRGVEGGGERER